MGTSINTATTQPIRHDLQMPGADHATRSSEGFFGRLVSWERDASSSCCPSAVKAWILFFVDKFFAFLDWTGIGHRISDGGLIERLQATRRLYEPITPEPTITPPEELDPTIAEAELNRRTDQEKIANALGGAEAFEAIPVVALQNGPFVDNLFISDDLFPQGHWVIKGEDIAGRKFIALRVQLKNIEEREPDPIMEGPIPADWGGPPPTFRMLHPDLQTTHIITVHQEETNVLGRTLRGLWSMNLVVDRPIQTDLSRHGSDLNSYLNQGWGPPVIVENFILAKIRELQESGSIHLRHSEGLQPPFPPEKRFNFERAPKP